MNSPEKIIKVSAPLHKPFAGGVPDRKWHVALVRRNYERLCRDKLQSLGHEAYVASQKETHVYGSRNRREVERLVIPGIVFILVNEKERQATLKECPLIYHYMTNRAERANDLGRHPFATIPDNQMERLRYMLYHAETPVNFTSEPLRLGDHIRVARGQLAGLEGTISRQASSTFLVVTLDILGSAMVTISPDDIERIA